MASLDENTEILLEQWKREIQRLPLPAHIQVAEGEALENMRRMAQAVLKAVDDGEAVALFEVNAEAYRSAQDLGRLRRKQGFSIEELVQEHVILRNEFWNLFREQVDLKHVVDFHLEKRINRCFDVLLQASASAYHYDFSRDIMENPLRDGVTKLYNKSYFHGRMIEELRRSVRYNHDITLVLLEVTNYYQLKKAGGEEKVGDLLRLIAAALSRMTRDCDVVARLGEGTFAVLLPETGCTGGQVMAARLSMHFAKELPPAVGVENPPELSWGLASFPEEVKLPEKLYACAVEAMRSSREQRPEKVGVYRSSESPEAD